MDLFISEDVEERVEGDFLLVVWGFHREKQRTLGKRGRRARKGEFGCRQCGMIWRVRGEMAGLPKDLEPSWQAREVYESFLKSCFKCIM